MKTLWARFGKSCSVAVFITLFGATLTQAQRDADGHGPDAWKVTGVAPNDVLNIRMGPGTDYPVTGAFAHDANGLQLVTCVPLITFEQGVAMSDAVRESLPPRWCLTTDAEEEKLGWVAARFLMEGSLSQASIAAPDGDPVANAVALVERLYTSHDQYMKGIGPIPYEAPLSDQFFSGRIWKKSPQLSEQPGPIRSTTRGTPTFVILRSCQMRKCRCGRA